jgi:hypothetical protein
MAEGVPGIHCALGDLHDSCFTWFFPLLLSLFSVYKHLCPKASVFKYMGDVIIMLVSKLTEKNGGWPGWVGIFAVVCFGTKSCTGSCI